MIKNIVTQSEHPPVSIGATQNIAWGNSRELLMGFGWRAGDEAPPIAEGYERLIAPVAVQDPDAPERFVWTTSDTLIHDRLDREAAAEVDRRNTPLIYDRPIEAPVLVLTSTPGGLGIAQVAGDDGTVAQFVYHASPVPSPEEIATRKAVALQEARDHRDRIVAIKGDLDAVEAALDAIDVTAAGTLGVAVAATTGVTKTALTEVRKVLVDVKAALKNLRQAAEKIRRDAR